MILRNATIKYKGYDPKDLSKGSHKKICCSCDECGRVRYIEFRTYTNLCRSCSKSGKNNSMYGKDTKITIKCDYCGKLKDIIPSVKYDHNFCNRECFGKWHSENQIRENHPNWNPNITDEERLIKRHYPEYKEW